MNCSKCGDEVDRLAVFPQGLCVNCWTLTPEANLDITAQELARMWGGR